MFDILIKNGIVYDGRGNPGVRTDVAINKNKIVALKDMPNVSAVQTIDASGLAVAPGFIDIQNHSDSHGQMLKDESLESLVGQGITTIAVGQCGASLSPLPNPEALKSLQKWGIFKGVNTDWQSHKQFIDKLSYKNFGTNIISFVGHANIRRVFTGDISRALTAEEIKQSALVLENSFKEGTFGVSFGFQYAHEIKSSRQEILSLLAVVKKHDKIFSAHLRSQSDELVASVEEVLDLALISGVKLKISHFKVEGKNNTPQLNKALTLIENAYQKGLQVRFDVYPYTTSWHPLYIYLPSWAYEGGHKPLVKRIKDKKLRLKILQSLKEQQNHISSLLISDSPKAAGFAGKTISQIAKNQSSSPEEALLRILSVNDGQVIVFDHDINPDQILELLKHPLSMVASDGLGISYTKTQENLVHPRCFGTFPRFLKLLQEQDNKPLMSWEEGIKKLTSLPAEFLGLTKRGIIKEDYLADITIFNPKEITDTSTYNSPYQQPIGINFVINNGVIALYDGKITDIDGGKVL